MSSRPSKEAAQKHISDIRKGKGLGRGDEGTCNAADLENALKIISDKLYQKSAHFILELVQNADDNKYPPGCEPTLAFTLEERYLRVDCNETGFTHENVDAICRIDESTKAKQKVTGGSIGEKGIGFKSVFKVADVVWISSGNYSFKFDKHKPLGMIAPIWEDLPSHMKTILGHTTFCLELSGEVTRRHIVDELHALDSRLLIFLRKLRKIKIKIVGQNCKPWESMLVREDGYDLGFNVSTLHQNNTTARYLKFRKRVDSLPLDERRPNISSSDIELAFPISAENKPKIFPQQVFAFLPVRDYGFQFLLQADFLLVSSREELIPSSECQWNRVLVDAFVPTIIEAFETFAHIPDEKCALRYAWVRYNPTVNRWRSLDSTFCKLKAKLTDSLSKSPLLEAEDGTFKAPNALMYIPTKFRDDDGIPLTLSPTTSRRYLSSKYFESDQKDLLDLGVQEMKDMQFLVDLAALISQHGPEFRQKRKRYHSMLAAAIAPFLGSRDGQAVQLVKTLPLLRLRGGTWATASELPIYFPGETEGHEIPEGVDARVTISKWSRDRQIHCLYLMLGVRHLSATEICSLIIKSHQSPNFKPQDLSPDVLISHVVFLFRSDWRASVSPELWFAAENGGRFRGSQLYKDSPADTHSVKKYLRNRRVPACNFLHSDYIFFAVSAEEEEKWTEWLRDVMNIWTIPRLVKPEPVDGQLVMTEQFRHIIRHFPSRTVLLLLRDNWKVYSEAIVVPMVDDKDGAVAPHKRKIKPAASSLVEGLSRTTVQCSENRHFLLCETFLPLGPWISAAADIVPFLEITEPEDSRWSYLEYFGVGVREDVRFHLKCLSELACAGEGSDSTWKRVSGLYESIQRVLDIKGDVELVRAQFQTKNLVFIPPSEVWPQGLWIPSSSCVWGAPTRICLRQYINIKDFYPDNVNFFCRALNVSNFNLAHIIGEMCSFQYGDNIQHIAQVFEVLDEYLKRVPEGLQHLKAEIGEILSRLLFPVRFGNSADPRGYDRLATGVERPKWFIADRLCFDTSFAGRTSLLAFDYDVNIRLGDLFVHMGLGDRRLSKVAKKTAVPTEPVELNPKFTSILRSKMDFVIRLIAELDEERAAKSTALRNVEVHGAGGVHEQWSVFSGDTKIEGAKIPGKVALNSEQENLRVFILEEHLRSSYHRVHFDLATQLAEYCEISTAYRDLMLYAISEKNHAAINEEFDNRGIRKLRPDEERQSYQYFGEAFRGNRTSERLSNSRVTQVAQGYFISKEVKVFSVHGKQIRKSRHSERRNGELGGSPSEDGKLYLASSDSDWSDTDTENGAEKAATGRLFLVVKGTRNLRSKRHSHRSPEFEEEVATSAELFFSNFLASILKRAYEPTQHWTSQRRDAKYEAYDILNCDEHEASFTIPDQDLGGRFTIFILENGIDCSAEWLETPPTYHVIVAGTTGDLDASFPLTNEEWSLARRFRFTRTSRNSRSRPSDVCILIRVSHIHDDPELAFFIDPWGLYDSRLLQIKAESRFKARVRTTDE